MSPSSSDILDRPAAESWAIFLPAMCWSPRHPDFYAVTEGISARGIGFRSSVVPEAGEALICSIRYIGTLRIRVAETGPQSFVARLSTSQERAAAVARTMMALAREQHRPSEPGRVHQRITPRRRDIVVTFEDGSTLSGQLINVSASGAAVYLPKPVTVGTVITLGAKAARVMRQFQDGIGAAFLLPLDPAEVEPGIRL